MPGRRRPRNGRRRGNKKKVNHDFDTQEPVESCHSESWKRSKVAVDRFSEPHSVAAGSWRSRPTLLSLTDLPDGVYLSIASGLEDKSACRLDRACRRSRELNRSPQGVWRALGIERFKGVRLEREGVFGIVPGMKSRWWWSRPDRVDWKSRYQLFAQALPTFRAPFSGRLITHVTQPDEVVFCRCMLPRAPSHPDKEVGVYMEMFIRTNPDNLSVALVDFEAGGHASITFSPDTGAVIKERKIQEMPRKVEGAYVQPLTAGPTSFGPFHGSVGIYVRAGHVAFFRRWWMKAGNRPAFWETTGYVTDLSWAEGPCVTPCVAFRDEGVYQVRIMCVGRTPPMDLGKVPTSYDENRWTRLDWEAHVGDY